METRIRVQKKAQRIQENNPNNWEDVDGGKRHVKADNDGAGTYLDVKDANGKDEAFVLNICSTYVRDGDWVTIDGTGREEGKVSRPDIPKSLSISSAEGAARARTKRKKR
jgi:hypothetical protein